MATTAISFRRATLLGSSGAQTVPHMTIQNSQLLAARSLPNKDPAASQYPQPQLQLQQNRRLQREATPRLRQLQVRTSRQVRRRARLRWVIPRMHREATRRPRQAPLRVRTVRSVASRGDNASTSFPAFCCIGSVCLQDCSYEVAHQTRFLHGSNKLGKRCHCDSEGFAPRGRRHGA